MSLLCVRTYSICFAGRCLIITIITDAELKTQRSQITFPSLVCYHVVSNLQSLTSELSSFNILYFISQVDKTFDLKRHFLVGRTWKPITKMLQVYNSSRQSAVCYFQFLVMSKTDINIHAHV